LREVCELTCVSAFIPEFPGMAGVFDGSVRSAFLRFQPAFEPTETESNWRVNIVLTQ
jgi:hypothetical protein